MKAINEGGVYCYLSKPWDDEQLLLTIRRALEFQRLSFENRKLNLLTKKQNHDLSSLNDDLERKVAERTRELREANTAIRRSLVDSLRALTGLIELRDPETSMHAKRVTQVARDIGKSLGLPDRELQDLEIGALLHDIGKLSIPTAAWMTHRDVYPVPGGKQYRSHPALGEAALMPIEALQNASALVRSHHELYDGTGFPDGLKNRGIPLGARIIRVADDLDHLVERASNGKRVKPARVVGDLLPHMGKLYDPAVVEALVAILRGKDRAELTFREKKLFPSDLKANMVLSRDLFTANGILIIPRDTTIHASYLPRLTRLQGDGQVNSFVYVYDKEKVS
jgi:response regulator RpfG family c-di-GMP phosphodiesterase